MKFVGDWMILAARDWRLVATGRRRSRCRVRGPPAVIRRCLDFDRIPMRLSNRRAAPLRAGRVTSPRCCRRARSRDRRATPAIAPLGSPRPRGAVLHLAAINPDGDDGRLVVDGRSGRMRAVRAGRGRWARSTTSRSTIYESDPPRAGLHRRQPAASAAIDPACGKPQHRDPVAATGPGSARRAVARIAAREPVKTIDRPATDQATRRQAPPWRSRTPPRCRPSRPLCPSLTPAGPPAARPAEAMPPAQGLE